MPPRQNSRDDPTLHLPRILCLHGGGTNARIFRMQCRVLSRQLQSHFRLVFAEAPFLCPKPGPDVTSVYRNYGPFKAWLPMFDNDTLRSNEEIVDAVDSALSAAICVDDLSGATGEWVAVMGFSQGAKVAASLLFSQQKHEERYPEDPPNLPHFRFGVVMAGRGPLVWMEPEERMPMGCVDASTLSTSTAQPSFPKGSTDHILHIPTIHVHGVKDPGLELHRGLLKRHCRRESTKVMEWEGDHRIPVKTADVERLVSEILSVARKTDVLQPVQEVKADNKEDFWNSLYDDRQAVYSY